jgi:hypothetical protein
LVLERLTTIFAQLHVCVGINECKCQFQDDQSIIDLTSLGHKDGSPRYVRAIEQTTITNKPKH